MKIVSCNVEDNNPWTTLKSNTVYQNNWIGLTEHEVINPSGGKGIYGVVNFKNFAIGILAIDKDLKTWLVGQYRYPLKTYSWEIPEGGGALDVEPLESAKRELLEETGLSAQNWKELQRTHLSNSVTDELSIIYLATDLILGEAEPEDTEQLEARKIPFQEVYGMVMRGEITDSITIIAVLKAKILLDEGALF